MKVVHESRDFRSYEPEIVSGQDGGMELMQLCEELDPESRRWEPFYAILPEHRVTAPDPRS